VRNSKEEYCQCRDEKVVEADLLGAIDIRGLVEAIKHPNRVLRYIHYPLSVLPVFHDACGGMQDWSVEIYQHLVCPNVKDYLKTALTSAGGI